VHDISVAFATATPEWPGDTPMHCGWAWDRSAGASVNVSRWTLSPHVGTHADAPLHVRTGAPGADALPVAPFLGDALLVDVSHHTDAITLGDLRTAGCSPGIERLLLRTGCSVADGSFPDAWPMLAPDAAAALAAAGLRLLGVDAPSVDARASTTLAVHHALFDGGAFVLENLDLRGVTAGRWDLLALPLRVGAVDAAPVRAFLRAPTTR
jgi:arylformamidase